MDLNLMAKFPWERWHPQLFASLRFAGGLCLLVLAAILLGYNTDLWLTPVLVALAVMKFYIAYRLPRTLMSMQTLTAADAFA